MAHLDKLAIRGIRSFDDKQIAVIEFFSPVTVIVGHNGSGKTTIIECLKYATTGDQPPNTRGGAFIHDPKMANEKEVKAQVKLRFYAANNTRMLAVRNLSLTAKKTTMTMKTLEGILSLVDGSEKSGKRTTISTKCAEMDIEIPQLLGVSKAVLENVIFCHQEDSYWPFSEPSYLKKKFDEIFEATRYTKALDSIKALRKDRLADLKAEQARLSGLKSEKQRSDELKQRISDTRSRITAKEAEYEKTKEQHDMQAKANIDFLQKATTFRETYLLVDKLQAEKARLHNDYKELKLNLQELTGSDEELSTRLNNFDEHISHQKQKLQVQLGQKEDLEEEIAVLRKDHTDSITQQGKLLGEAEAHRLQIKEREQLIHEISETHKIKGYNYSPLEREKAHEFLSRIEDLRRKQMSDLGKIQAELREKSSTHQQKILEMEKDLGNKRLQKTNFQNQIAACQSTIKKTERQLEDELSIKSELSLLRGEMEEKKSRLSKMQKEFTEARFDPRISEKTETAKRLEDKREELNMELRSLSTQADSRARLDVKRAETRNKSQEATNTLILINEKYHKFSSKDLSTENPEEELEELLSQKEKERSTINTAVANIRAEIQNANKTKDDLVREKQSKIREVEAIKKKVNAELTDDLEGLPYDEALKAVADEIEIRRRDVLLGQANEVYENFIKMSKAQKKCQACSRHLDDHETVTMEKTLKALIKGGENTDIAESKETLSLWEEIMEKLQKLRPADAKRKAMEIEEIPALEARIKELEQQIPEMRTREDEEQEKLDEIKELLREITNLKQQASAVARLQKDAEKARQDALQIENNILNSGTTKTTDDVQKELDELAGALRTAERERKNITGEKERQTMAIRNLEDSMHAMEKQELGLLSKLHDQEAQKETLSKMRDDIASFTEQIKVLEIQIGDGEAPIEALETAFQDSQNECNRKSTQVQQQIQEFNTSINKLSHIHRAVERYIKERRDRQLENISENVQQLDINIQEGNKKLEAIRNVISDFQREINESGASVANLRDNIRARRLIKEISAVQEEIGTYNMEEVAKARRNFDEKYPLAKEKESNLQTECGRLQGELDTLLNNVEEIEFDLKKNFKDVNKRYTDQLIKVKVSDMANNDLEKYAKALDNAIMKYHTLKMEEVNDIMKHLWNKTYQGTDIDGIMIKSDVEGAANKRSYNYRVVMSKDQVEMDMRGRCSAGQKMLASIIIRLALSDSFGQNCGILALDEPTNALDTENIDALAASLIDIINERRTHSNFQLIIITHDENFLRKLGQNDVMEYYWRVSRDGRQKSIIERQRFR